jgi:hypothetical protein
VDQPLNIKHVITTLGHTQSVTLYIRKKTVQLILQSGNTGIHKTDFCALKLVQKTIAPYSKPQGVQKARQVRNPLQKNTMPRHDN